MKVAAIQMCSSHSPKQNLANAAKLLAEAAAEGVKLVVLPEMFALMGLKSTDVLDIQEPFGEGLIQDFLAEQAMLNKLWIVGGTVAIATENKNKFRAASLLYNDKGELAARYDKIHLFDVDLSATEIYRESDTVDPGNEVVVVDTPVGKVGMAVCYDLRFPELFRSLVNKGAEIIVIPAAFTQKTGEAHWELLLRSRAVENFCYVVAANQGGTHSSGRKTYGHSLVVEPWGKVIASIAGVESGVVSAVVDLEYLKKLRLSIPALQHQRDFFQGGI